MWWGIPWWVIVVLAPFAGWIGYKLIADLANTAVEIITEVGYCRLLFSALFVQVFLCSEHLGAWPTVFLLCVLCGGICFAEYLQKRYPAKE